VTCAIAFAQPKSDSRIADLLNDLASTRQFADVAISPDGARVAWVDDAKAEIYVKTIASGAPVRIASGRKIAWSPDSTRLAFLSDDKQPQLCVVAAKGGKARKLTTLTGYLTDPQWSPDGSKIAILFAENAAGGGGPLEAEPVETGVIGGEIHNQRLTVVDAASGVVKQI